MVQQHEKNAPRGILSDLAGEKGVDPAAAGQKAAAQAMAAGALVRHDHQDLARVGHRAGRSHRWPARLGAFGVAKAGRSFIADDNFAYHPCDFSTTNRRFKIEPGNNA